MPESYAADAQVSRLGAHAEAGVESSFASPSIPSSYGITRVSLMTRDPHSIFGYWELTPEFREMTARHFGCDWEQLPLVLRLYLADEAESPHMIREVDVSHLTDNWFFHELLPGRTYVLDLGTRNIYGVFVALLRSNTVATPRNWPGKSVPARRSVPWQIENITSPMHFRS